MRRGTLAALAVLAFSGAWVTAAAAPADEVVKRRSAQVEPPYVPSIGPKSIHGYTRKMRGERIAYCRFERKLGTRFRTETCIDEARMDEYLKALAENQRQAKELGTGETRIN